MTLPTQIKDSAVSEREQPMLSLLCHGQTSQRGGEDKSDNPPPSKQNIIFNPTNTHHPTTEQRRFKSTTWQKYSSASTNNRACHKQHKRGFVPLVHQNMDTITNCNRCSKTERKVISKGGGYATASAGGDGTHSSPRGILDLPTYLQRSCLPQAEQARICAPRFIQYMNTTIIWEERGGDSNLQGWRLISKGGNQNKSKTNKTTIHEIKTKAEQTEQQDGNKRRTINQKPIDGGEEKKLISQSK